jgi:hypothetical protein
MSKRSWLHFWVGFAAVTLLAMCTGCATTETSSTRAEAVWQGLNVLDTAQTLNIAKRPDCFREVDPLTSRLIGSKPDTAEVLAVGLAYAWAHDRVSGWLDRKTTAAVIDGRDSRGAWYVARIGWHAVGLVTKAHTVANNHSIGMRPFGAGCSQ